MKPEAQTVWASIIERQNRRTARAASLRAQIERPAIEEARFYKKLEALHAAALDPARLQDYAVDLDEEGERVTMIPRDHLTEAITRLQSAVVEFTDLAKHLNALNIAGQRAAAPAVGMIADCLRGRPGWTPPRSNEEQPAKERQKGGAPE